MANPIGKNLGKYRIIERLGRGGMAIVYKAYHPQLDRYVAIKMLHGYLAEGKDFLARFEREARAVAALRHPHIVQVYDFDIEDEIYYMVMEFIDGKSMKTRLQELHKSGDLLPLNEAAGIFGHIAEALEYAHQQGMLHRDVKPANVLLDKSGRAFLTDFGIARILSDTQITATGALVGTPEYMSPEQGRGLPLTEASDVYSLGIILYELITCQVPFGADTPLAVIYKHIHDPLPLPRSLRPDIPAALERTVLKALAKDPEDRYQSVAEMQQAVEQALSLETKTEIPPTVSEAIDVPVKEPLGFEAVYIPEEEPPDSEVVEVPVEEPQISEMPEAVPILDLTPEPTGVIEEPLVEPEEGVKPEPVEGESLAGVVPAESFKPEVGVKKPASVVPVKRRRIKPLAILLGVVGLAIIALVIALAGGFFGGGEECLTFDECYDQAMAFVDEQNYDRAVEQFYQALNFAPDDEHPSYAHLWCELGTAYIDMEQFEDAIYAFETCIEWIEGNPELEDLRTSAKEQLGELYDEPGSDLCSSVEECEAQALDLMDAGDFVGADELLHQALDLAPEGENPPFAQYWCRLGEAYREMGQLDEAIFKLEICIEWAQGDPELEDLRVSAGEQLDMFYNARESGLCSSVEECYDQAMESWRAGDLENADEMLHRALDFVPGDEQPPYAYLWCELGEVYFEMEQIEDAIYKYELCIEWTEGDPELEELRTSAKERLQSLREN